MARIGNRLEMLHQRHDARLSDSEEQEFETMERIAGAWSGVLDLVKSRQVERRDDEAKPRPENQQITQSFAQHWSRMC